MDAPTPTIIRDRSNLTWSEYGYPVPQSGTDRLQYVIDEAVPEFKALTGVDIALIEGNPVVTGYDKRTPLIQKAIRLLVEFNVLSSQQDTVETAGDFDMIQNMSAGDYSETRRAVGSGKNVLHPWPVLNRLLLDIVYFDSQGQPATDVPGISHVEPNWNVGENIINAKRRAPGGYFGIYDPPWETGEIYPV